MKKFFQFFISLLLVIAIIASIGWYLFVYDRDFTRDALLSQARYNDLYGNARLSSLFYNLAYEHSGRDENVAIELANQYKADGNFTKAEVTLSNAIKNKGTVELYTALCKTYVQQDKLMDAVALLNNIADPNMKSALDALRPTTPATSHEPGFYSQYIDLALTSSSGTLYYTMDGEYPSISGSVYEAPLELEAGETVIYAISVDSNGLVSEPVVAGYTIGGVIEPVEFDDKAMEAAIREVLGARESEILYTNVLWDITEFTVPADAKSLADLQLMPYLKSLTIQGHSLGTLVDLSSMSKLETLDLTGTTFPAEELAVLAKLPNLTKLILSNCGLSTIASLEGAEKLSYLDLSSNTVRNMDALIQMKTLKELYLQHNAVTGLEALSSLTNLEKLNIAFNSVTDLTPLSTCMKLNWLDAGNNALTTINGVEGLSLLSYLSVDYNNLSDVSIVAACRELTNLSIANNQISDISALSALTKLDILDFSYNSVSALPEWQEGCTLRTIDGSYNSLSSIDNLANLANISYIYMDYNNITNVNALANCYVLVQLNVYGNDIDTVAELTAHDIIVNYDPT
ncbi:MAG: leucine-rich repeat domain-containing protein [Oscillospiraceae bacterium]|nr:leucine-rich repeat domain-containing protein [Oscillospiraceae bacterium]